MVAEKVIYSRNFKDFSKLKINYEFKILSLSFIKLNEVFLH